MQKRTLAIIAICAFVVVACSGGSSNHNNETPEPEPPTVPEVEPPMGMDVFSLVEALASDEMGGRDNLSPGSELAQTLLVDELSLFANPVFEGSEGIEGYLQHYDLGTNILAIVPGGELADEYVMIGAHYDHHGNNCAGISDEDNICNGANDNATGVAAALDIARSIVADGVPRRSIIITLWDGEEDGLIGAKYYAENPVVPLEQTIAYVNFDIQGANLLPSIRNFTILVGAETGGSNLLDAAKNSLKASSLETVMLSLIYGQGRSDHAVFAAIGVPSVFFTDANTGCYHTVKDDIDAVDFSKLEQQILTAEALTRDLVVTDAVPVFDPTAPLSSYEDAVQLLRIVEGAQADFGLFSPDQQVASEQFLLDLQNIVDLGADVFDSTAAAIVLGGAANLVATLSSVECDPFISDG